LQQIHQFQGEKELKNYQVFELLINPEKVFSFKKFVQKCLSVIVLIF